MATHERQGQARFSISQEAAVVIITDGSRTVRAYYDTHPMAKRMVSTLQKRLGMAGRWLQIAPVQLSPLRPSR